MAMDEESFVVRWKRRPKPKEILASLLHQLHLGLLRLCSRRSSAGLGTRGLVEPDYDTGQRSHGVRTSVNWSGVSWKRGCCREVPYRARVDLPSGLRKSENSVHDHIWGAVNSHLGTCARSIPELVEQLGIMRYGHRPRVADTFCGSGQIPFEAARLGCDVYASDLNPVACMLTWGASSTSSAGVQRTEIGLRLSRQQAVSVEWLMAEIDSSG